MRTRRIKAVFSANTPVTLRPREFSPSQKKRPESCDSGHYEYSVREIISWSFNHMVVYLPEASRSIVQYEKIIQSTLCAAA